MLNFLLSILINGLAVYLAAKLLAGVTIRGYVTALWVGILISILNATLGFILRLLTFPLIWLTLGLLSFVITIIIILLVDRLVDGFKVKNFGWAAVFAIVVALINAVLQFVFL